MKGSLILRILESRALLCIVSLHLQVEALSKPNWSCSRRSQIKRGSGCPFTGLYDRRNILASLVTSNLLFTANYRPNFAYAIGEGPERIILNKELIEAPVAALIPACQQRLLLEIAMQLARQETNKDYEAQLKWILPPLDENSYLANLNGRQNYKILQSNNPRQVLRGDVVRAAMNLYQTNLNYNKILARGSNTATDDAAFTVTDPAWKKAYIRSNNGLPDVTKMIGADLDVRLLLRNQVQQALDDAAAELYNTTPDRAEVLALLQQAAQSFDLWLDRIRPLDVEAAAQAALLSEKKQTPFSSSQNIYDSYMAGFMPPPSTPLP